MTFSTFFLMVFFKPSVFIPSYSAEISSEKKLMKISTVIRGQTKGSFTQYPVSKKGYMRPKSVSCLGTNRNEVKFKIPPLMMF